MSRVWAVVAKDLLQTSRDRMAAIFTVLMPLAFTAFLGVVIGGVEERYPVAVADRDASPQSRLLVRELRRSTVVVVRSKAVGEVDAEVDDQHVVAGLVIPLGFGAAVEAGREVELTVVRDAGSVAGQSAVAEIRRAVEEIGAARRTTSAAIAGVAAVLKGVDSSLGPSSSELTPERLSSVVADRLEGLPSSAIEVRSVEAGGGSLAVPSGFDQTSPGMIVNFILFGLVTSAGALMLERQSGTLSRLRTTCISRLELITGKAVGMFVLTFVQQVVLVVAGALGFGVGYFNDPGALVLVMVSLSLLVACLGLLLATLFQSEQALIAAAVLLSMGWSALSGAWFPLEITGPTFSAVGHALPTAWILDGFRGISLRGWGVLDVLPACGVAAGWAAGFLGLAVWRFRVGEQR